MCHYCLLYRKEVFFLKQIQQIQQIPETEQISENDLFLLGKADNTTRTAKIKHIISLVQSDTVTSESIESALGYVPTSTKVKGNAEETYRTGEVNLTAENIGVKVMQGATEIAPGESGLVPAPEVAEGHYNLTASGDFENNGVIRIVRSLSTKGWYRIAKIAYATNTGGYVTPFMLNIGKTFSNTTDESASIICTASRSITEWRTIGRNLYIKGLVSKVRISRKSGSSYIEVYYDDDTTNWVGITLLANSSLDESRFKGWMGIDFEPAEADETVVSEYTIPDKDDISTSKSLTNFTEIPKGADMKSSTYLVPGNYVAIGSAIAGSLTNSPFKDTFRLTVEFAGGNNLVRQIMLELRGRITKVIPHGRAIDIPMHRLEKLPQTSYGEPTQMVMLGG